MQVVIFRSYQWDVQRRNTTLWFADDFAGTEPDLGVNYAKVIEGCGLKDVQVRTIEELTGALRTAVKERMEDGVITFVEFMLNQEPGGPFRRDAIEKPTPVAGIRRKNMRPQRVARSAPDPCRPSPRRSTLP